MIGRLVQILAAADESPDATELRDALWLAEHTPRRPVSPASPGASPVIPDERDGLLDAASPPDEAARLHLTEPPSRAAEPGWPPGGGGAGGILAGVPAVPAIPAAMAITRALRPLRTRVDGPTRGVVDEDASARNIADSGLWLPELRPDPERWLDLVLIVDDSDSMRVWRRTVTEFQALLRQLAAFRELRTLTINTDENAAVPRLDGTHGRRLALVLTDCVGRAWTQGPVLRSLETLRRSGPVAIVQMLPQRLWTGCGLAFVPVRIGADPAAAAPPRIWDRMTGAELPGGDPDRPGVPIPVLELDARWLGPWATMLAGQAARPIAGMAVFTRSDPVPMPPPAGLTGPGRVALFRSVASPAALRLASYLAAAPLSLPVMRLVQRVMLPWSQPADLAEVFLSGLLCRVAEPRPGVIEFDFHQGVRELLLSGLRRAEALRVYRLVSAYVSNRLGSAPEFPALFGPFDAEPLTVRFSASLSDPFAAVALTVLRSVGGQYTEIADKLAATARLPAEPAVVEPASTGGPRMAERSAHRPLALRRGVPPRNPNFTGRGDLLLALRSQLGQEQIAALVPVALRGLGGVGKTHIALEYVYRFAEEYDLICWISAEQPGQLRAGLAALAPDLNILPAADVSVTVTKVVDALNRGEPYSRWLLVVDNADDPGPMKEYLPQAGHVLITSRNQGWNGVARTYQVAEFTREESISLIKRHNSTISDADADLLADRLGDLPIAVEQAAMWLSITEMTVQGYLTLLDRQMSTLLAENPPSGYPRTIVAAWTLAFDDLRARAPEGAALVQLCSFLGPDPIPYALLNAFRHTPDLPPEMERMLQEEFTFTRAVRQATERALLKTVAGQQALTEHRLVQAVLREHLSEAERDEMTRLVWRMLITANPGRPDDPRNWDMLAAIHSHMAATRLLDCPDPRARGAIIDQIRFLYAYGDQSSSRELGEEAVLRWRDAPGPSDEQTLIASRLLGIVRRELGQVAAAREINEDTLAKTVEVFGSEHEHTLITANSYACDLRIAGQYAAALERDQELYEQHKRVFRENDEATFRSAHNLAIDMRLNGKYEEAYQLDQDNYERRLSMLGDQRWETWSSVGAIGRDLRGLGQFAESAQLLAEAIPKISELLEPNHPEVIRMRMDYAASLRRSGRIDEAIHEAEACLELNLRRLGEHHNYTLSVMTILVQALRLAGHTDRAHTFAKRALEAAPATYGAEHSLVTTCEHNYAVALRAIGNHAAAYDLDQRINGRFRQVLTRSSRPAMSSDMSLARDLELAGDTTRAEQLLTEVRDTSQEVRGPRHPRTLFSAANLARLLRIHGKEEESAAITAETIPVLQEILGPKIVGTDHPEVLMAERGEFIELEIDIPDR